MMIDHIELPLTQINESVAAGKRRGFDEQGVYDLTL